MFGPSRSIGRGAAALLLAALASCFTGSAHAAAAKSVILTQPPSGGITPKGDPFYNFTMNASLGGIDQDGPGFDLWVGDSFTIMAAIGMRKATMDDPRTSLTFQPSYPDGNLPAGDSWSVDIQNLNHSVPWPGVDHELVETANITWTLSTTNMSFPPILNGAGINPLPLGQFTFQTYDDFSVLPPDTSITYTYIVHAHRGGVAVTEDGTITFTLAVPEPGSIALLALGAAVPVVAAARRRRRRAAG